MARSLCFTVCLLVLLQAFLPSARATYPALSTVFSDASTSSLASVRNVYSDTITRTSSCSSTSVASYRGNSAAFAFSSNKAKTTAVVSAAVKAAADAMADAAASMNGKCRSAEDTSEIYAIAEACASAMIKGRAESFSVAYAAGSSSATSTGCAYSSAYAATLVKGLADAVSYAISGDVSKCLAFSTTEGVAYVEAVAKLTISGMAASWSYAHAYGGKQPSKAVAASAAVYSNDVSVYATAIARLFAYACSHCSTGGVNHCAFCNNWMIPAGDWVSTETFGVAAKGRVALAEAISDASSRLCSKTITVDTAVRGSVAAMSNVFVQLTAAAYGWGKAGNNAVACSGAYSSTNAFALSKTYASVVSSAFALALKKDQCAAGSCADIFAEATAKVKFEKFIDAYAEGCTGKTSSTYMDIATKCYDHVYDVYSESLSNAFAEITTECKCAGNCWCCNDFPEKRQCSY